MDSSYDFLLAGNSGPILCILWIIIYVSEFFFQCWCRDRIRARVSFCFFIYLYIRVIHYHYFWGALTTHKIKCHRLIPNSCWWDSNTRSKVSRYTTPRSPPLDPARISHFIKRRNTTKLTLFTRNHNPAFLILIMNQSLH